MYKHSNGGTLRLSQEGIAMSNPPEFVHEKIQHIPRLTGHDFCDLCGAQAYFAVKLHKDNEALLFCMHHSYVHEPKLTLLKPFAILDQREQLFIEESLMR